MNYTRKKRINFLLAGLWLLNAILHIIEPEHISVIVLMFIGSAIFFFLGLLYARKEKQESGKNQR